jgi:heterodisulfide reductase subunit A
VTLVEKSPILGGLPVRYEEIFPHMECAPCLLEPLLAEVLHGACSDLIDVHLTSEVDGVKGSFGNFDVRIRQAPRYVSVADCVGCEVCTEACPGPVANPLGLGRDKRKAIDFELFGGLPSLPVLGRRATGLRTATAATCACCRALVKFVDGATKVATVQF